MDGTAETFIAEKEVAQGQEPTYAVSGRYSRPSTVHKGYAETVTDQSSDKMCWYIPHHPVHNPKKPDKLRIVFDCAAKYKGIFFNDVVLQGPDLTNNLQGVFKRCTQFSLHDASCVILNSTFHMGVRMIDMHACNGKSLSA